MKIRKILCAVIIFALAAVFVCLEPVRVLANGQSDAYAYLKDIKLITDCTKAEAEKWFGDNGYKIADSDFVKASFGENAYLGYKTTRNKNEAITDIRLMNMQGGFETVDFNEKLENKFTASFNEGATKLKNAFAEFKKNVEAHNAGTRLSPMAKAGEELLNQFTYKDTPLYDYLASDACTLEDYKRIMAITTTDMLSYIFFCMMLGVYYDTDTDFQAELNKNTLFAVKPTDDYGALDASFYDDAKDLYASIGQFAESYALAVANYDKDAEILQGLDATDTEVTADALLEKLDEQDSDAGIIILDDNASAQNADNDSTVTVASSMAEVDALKDDEDAAASHVYALNAYDILSKYTVTSDYADNLADYLIRSASMEDETEGVRMLYPIIDMLTPGQLLALKSVGIETFVLFLDNNTQATYDLFRSELDAVADGNTYSIFTDVDTDLYERTCAYTDEAVRRESSGSQYVYDSRDHDGDHKTTEMQMRRIIGITSIACGAIVIAGSVAVGIGGGTLTTAFTLAVSVASMMYTSGVVVGTSVALVVGGACLAIAVVVVVAIVVMVIIWLINLFTDDEPEEVERTEIPDILFDYDNDTDAFIKYEVLTDPMTNEGVDIANEQSTEWDALYYSYSSNRGSPIIVKDDTLFTENYSNASVENMMPLVRFGDTLLAGDTRRCSGSSFLHIYLYYYSEDSLAGKSGGTTQTDGVYISDIKIASGSTESEARSLLLTDDYTVINQNLTPTVEGTWTYLGYKTTKNVDEALTDIRVGFDINTKKEQYLLGKSSYGCSGTLATGASIHITSSEYAGTPILVDAGLIIVDDRSKAPAGYEPVSLFCGGDAFDLCFCENQTDNWDSHVYIYYRPSVTYTSGTEYISGMASIVAKEANGYSAEDYIAACGFKSIEETYGITDMNLLRVRYGSDVSAYDGIYDDVIMKLCYSTTYNPYRAVTDIQLMEYSASVGACLSSVTYGGNAYSVCEVFEQGLDAGHQVLREKQGSDSSPCRNVQVDKSITLAANNGIDWRPYGFGSLGFDTEDCASDAPIAFNIYVTCNTGDTPIAVDDIAFCRDADTPEKLVAAKEELGDASDWQGVHFFGHAYDSNAENLCHQVYYYYQMFFSASDDVSAAYTNVDHHVYMYIRRQTPERPKYVKSVTVCSSVDDETSTNDVTRIEAFSSTVGELIEYNFAATADYQWKYTEDGKTYYQNTNGSSAYLYITYTNNKLEAIRELRLVSRFDVESPELGSKYEYQVYDYKKGEPAKSQYSKDEDGYATIPFTCCGGLINYGFSPYYLYTSTNSFFGSPITDVYFDGNTLNIDAETACWMDGSFVKDSIAENTEYYFHVKRETSAKEARYASLVAVCSGETERECLDKLYDAGCDKVFNYNFDTEGKYCYLGYKEETTALYNYVITGLKMYSSTENRSASAMEDVNMLQYSLGSDQLISSTYQCLNVDGYMGVITSAEDASSDDGFEGVRYRYLYGTYNEELCSGIMMNTLAVTEGVDSVPDVQNLADYKKLIEGAVTGAFTIKNRKANTTLKNLYNLFVYGAGWNSQYVAVSNVIETTGDSYADGKFNIGCADGGKATMWYKNSDTFYNTAYTGDVKSLFDTAYTNDKTLTIYPTVTVKQSDDGTETKELSAGAYLLFNDYATDAVITVPSGVDAVIYMRGNSITGEGVSAFSVEGGASLTLEGDNKKQSAVYTYSTAADSSALPKSCITVKGTLAATNVRFDPGVRDVAICVGAYSAIDYAGEGLTLTGCIFSDTYGWLINGLIYAHGGNKITVANCNFHDAVIGWNYAAVNLIGVDADITDCAFADLEGSAGGALNVQENATANLKNCTIYNCSATGQSGDGGGIYAYEACVNMVNTDIKGCSAECRGGGLYARLSACTLKDCDVVSNTSGWLGGGIYAYETSIDFEGGSLSSNNASSGGGMIIAGSSSELTLTDTEIKSNTAADYGAGVDMETCIAALTLDGNVYVTDNTINGNASNLCLPAGQTMNVDDLMQSKIGIQSASQEKIVYLTEPSDDVPKVMRLKALAVYFTPDASNISAGVKGGRLALTASGSAALASLFGDGNVLIVFAGFALLALSLTALVIFYKKKNAPRGGETNDRQKGR